MKVLSLCLKKQNLLIVQDLWQVQYQIFLIISQKEFIKLSVKVGIVFLNMKVSRTPWWNINAYLAIKIIAAGLMKNLKIDLRTHLSFLIMISVNLFCCLMKQHYLIKNNLIATSVWNIFQMQITCIQKEFEKTLK